MRTPTSMRLIALTLALVSALILSSCETRNTPPVSFTDTQSSSVNTRSELSFLSLIPKRFTQNDEFVSCLKQSTDMCMQEASYMMEDSLQLDCDEFISEQNRQSCLFTQVTTEAHVKGDEEICDRLEGALRTQCVYEVKMQFAMESGDTSVCDELEDYEKISCNNRIVTSQALRAGDPSMCDKIMSYEGDEENFEKVMCEDEVRFMLEIETEQVMNAPENISVENEITENQE